MIRQKIIDVNQSDVEIRGKYLVINLKGKQHRFEINKISKRLAKATPQELKEFSVSASGYGIHWDKIDEDISIPALFNEPVAKYGRKSL